MFLTDTTSVDIRALVSRDISRATLGANQAAGKSFAERVFGVSEFVLMVELGLILVMTAILIALIVRARRLMREQKEKVASAERMTVKRPGTISKSDIERILNQIAREKVKSVEMGAGKYYVDDNGRLDSGAAIHEMARTHGMESERLNFAISYASQAAKQSGTKFKEAFALVSEESDLNVLARQLKMGKGELELILALKKSKIANSRSLPKKSEGKR